MTTWVYIRMLVAVICLSLFAGCSTITPAVNRPVTLTGKVFGPTEYRDKFDVYTTSDNAWLYILTTTEVENGTLMDLKPGLHVGYDAQYFEWITDNTGWRNFCYFADSVTILKTKKIHKQPIRLKERK